MGSLQNYRPGLKSKTYISLILIFLPVLCGLLLVGTFLFFPNQFKHFLTHTPHTHALGLMVALLLGTGVATYSLIRLLRKGALSHHQIQTLQIPSLVTNKGGRILDVNGAFQEFFPDAHHHIEEMIPYLYSPDERDLFEELLQDARSGYQLETKKYAFAMEHQEVKSLDVCCIAKGDALFWTFAPSAQKSTFFSDTAFQRALDSTYLFNITPSGNVILDQDGKIQGFNDTFQHNFLKDQEVNHGTHFIALLAPSCAKDINQDLVGLLESKKQGAAIEMELSGGDRVIAYISRLSFDDQTQTHQGYYLQIFDNTEQRNLQLRLAQSQKLQALGQLAGGIAHDFNNLLTAMIGFCDLLLMRLSPGDQSFTDIMQIKQNGNRATNLVRQLLAFSRQQTLQPTVLDVSEVLSDLSVLLQRLIGSRIELKIIHDRSVDYIKVDRSQFEQVIVNLVVNAKDAIIGEGTVRIITKLCKFDKPMTLDHETLPAGSYIQIEVIDDGQGISRKNLERVFDPFFSTKNVGEGTGLGLATAYGTVKQTGGHISVDSTVGVGTKFTILLPQYKGKKMPQESHALDAQGEHPTMAFKDLTGQGYILLAEDEDAVRLFAARALTDKGYKVDQAQHGLEALEILKRLHASGATPPDLLITDVVMPKMDGPTLVKEAQELFPSLKVMYISGYAEDAFRDMVRFDDKIRFLAKPFSLKVLASRVKENMEGSSSMKGSSSTDETPNTLHVVGGTDPSL